MDVTNRIVSVFRNDTSQAEAALKRLRGVERDRAKEVLVNLNSENDKLEAAIGKWVKIGLVVGGAVAAYKAAQAAAKGYLEDVRLESAAAGADIDRLRAATLGLVEADNLLAFAGKAQAGVWKLNQEEMERVLRGATALRKTMGVELQPTIDALTAAITKGATRGIREFGIEAKDKAGVLRALDELWKKIGGDAGLAGDDMQRAGVKIADVLDDLQGAIGKVVIQLGPMIDGVATLITKFAQLLDIIPGWLVQSSSAVNSGSAGTQLNKQIEAWKLMAGVSDQRRAVIGAQAGTLAGSALPDIQTLYKMGFSDEAIREMASLDRAALSAAIKGATRERDAALVAEVDKGVQEVHHAIMAAVSQDIVQMVQQRAGGRSTRSALEGIVINDQLSLAGPGGLSSIGAGLNLPGLPSGPGGQAPATAQDMERIAQIFAQAGETNARILAETRGRTMLQAIFGSPGDIELTTVALGQLGRGFDVVAQAGGAAMDAWITGSQSLGQAIRGAVAEGLRGIAVQATVEALKEAAFGVANLAMFNYGGAALHFKAAALFGGVALAAGVGARAMGAGQVSTGGAAAGSALGGGPSRSSAPAEPQQRQVVIMLGRDFLGLTDLEQRQLVYQATKQATSGQITTRNIRRS